MSDDRLVYLEKSRNLSREAAVLIYETPTTAQVKLVRKVIRKTYNMLQRIAKKDYLTVSSFRGGYGGKRYVIPLLIEFEVIREVIEIRGRKKVKSYELRYSPEGLTLELAQRIYVEVYLRKRGM